MEEKRDFFVRAGQIEDEDELMDELNELEAEMAAEEFEGVEIGSGALEYGQANKAPVIAAPAKNKAQTEEDELRALEQMMA